MEVRGHLRQRSASTTASTQTSLKLAPKPFKALANLPRRAVAQTGLIRLQVAAAMGYFVAPFDAFPSGSPLGWLDDVFVALHVLRAARDSAGVPRSTSRGPTGATPVRKLDDWYEPFARAAPAAARIAARCGFIGLDIAPSDV